MFAHKAGMMPVAKPVLTRLLNERTKAEIVNLAIDVGGKAVRDAIAFMGYNLDLESFLLWLNTYMDNCSVEMNRLFKESTCRYVLKHDLGDNWSLYYKTMLQFIFSEGLKNFINVTDSLLIFEFEYNNDNQEMTIDCITPQKAGSDQIGILYSR
jgi:hypothetical protein